MNRAATQDLRNAKVLRSIRAVLETGPAPTPRDQQMLDLLKAWRASGSSRLDRDGDGKIDDPGAAIMDKAWPKIADAVMSPVLGPQLGQLASLIPRDNPANRQGSAYITGWYGYVDKDLRRVAGRDVDGPFKTRFCGGSADTIGSGHGHGHGKGHGKGHGWDDDDDDDDWGWGRRWGRHKQRNPLLTACRNSLWAAVHAAGDELATEQGTADPAAWRKDANPERITFQPGFMPFTMRWTNRPTFQQVISYSGHR
jgi:hypothetical protein